MQSVEQTVQRLVTAGERLPPAVEEALLAHGAAAVPGLLAVLADDALRAEDAPGEGWAPLHAAALLGALEARSALPAMLLRLREVEPGEGLQEVLTDTLLGFGADVVEPALAVLQEHPDDPMLHDYVGQLLAKAGVRDGRVLAALLRELELSPESGAMHLYDYGDPAALPALVRAFDAHAPDPGRGLLASQPLIELAATIEHLGGALTEAQRHKLEGSRSLRRHLLEGLRRTLPSQRAERPGRNEPCWCGSGQKYKRCHLAEDQHAGSP